MPSGRDSGRVISGKLRERDSGRAIVGILREGRQGLGPEYVARSGAWMRREFGGRGGLC